MQQQACPTRFALATFVRRSFKQGMGPASAADNRSSVRSSQATDSWHPECLKKVSCTFRTDGVPRCPIAPCPEWRSRGGL